MDTWTGSPFSAIMNNASVNKHVQSSFLCEHVFSILSDLYGGVENLGHRLTPSLTLHELLDYFPKRLLRFTSTQAM